MAKIGLWFGAALLVAVLGWRTPPTAWDYHVEKMDFDRWDKDHRLEARLDSLGTEGWELVVGVEQHVNGSFSVEPNHIFVFKRAR